MRDNFAACACISRCCRACGSVYCTSIAADGRARLPLVCRRNASPGSYRSLKRWSCSKSRTGGAHLQQRGTQQGDKKRTRNASAGCILTKFTLPQGFDRDAAFFLEETCLKKIANTFIASPSFFWAEPKIVQLIILCNNKTLGSGIEYFGSGLSCVFAGEPCFEDKGSAFADPIFWLHLRFSC